MFYLISFESYGKMLAVPSKDSAGLMAALDGAIVVEKSWDSKAPLQTVDATISVELVREDAFKPISEPLEALQEDLRKAEKRWNESYTNAAKYKSELDALKKSLKDRGISIDSDVAE